jgi:hypothetical protein
MHDRSGSNFRETSTGEGERMAPRRAVKLGRDPRWVAVSPLRSDVGVREAKSSGWTPSPCTILVAATSVRHPRAKRGTNGATTREKVSGRDPRWVAVSPLRSGVEVKQRSHQVGAVAIHDSRGSNFCARTTCDEAYE